MTIANTTGLLAQEEALNQLRGPVRLRTLTTLRWLAVAGQIAAILLVNFVLGFPLPLGLSLAIIATSAWLNLFTTLRFSPQRFLRDREAAAYMSFDIVQLCALLFVTGGLQNPFAVLILAPVTIAAGVLPLRLTGVVSALAIAGISILATMHMPLPWFPGETLMAPTTFIAGVWAALTFSVIFFAAYTYRIAAESAQMKKALAATQLILAREERLAALGGLAAAAAHELGTPLATIQVSAKEMSRDLEGQGLLKEDAKLILSQAERCRDILGRLSRRGDEGDVMHDRLSVLSLMKEAAGPFVDSPGAPQIFFDVGVDGEVSEERYLKRRPEIIYGLRNFIENAVSFAHGTVELTADWTATELNITIADDGPGFSTDVLARLGEPYISARARANAARKPSSSGGMGLGFFIAKTLLERSGAKVVFDNRKIEDGGAGGAWISTTWPMAALQLAPEMRTASESGGAIAS